jgi:hypothetical protein
MNLIAFIRAKPWMTFFIVQVIGTLCIVGGSGMSLSVYLAGLLLLAPGSFIQGFYLYSLFGDSEIRGVLYSDLLFIPLSCFVNAVIVWIVKSYLLPILQKKNLSHNTQEKKVSASEA